MSEYTETDARLNWLQQRAMDGLPSPTRDELAAFMDGFRAAKSPSWQAQAYMKLGFARDDMTPQDVWTVQQFIGPMPESNAASNEPISTKEKS